MARNIGVGRKTFYKINPGSYFLVSFLIYLVLNYGTHKVSIFMFTFIRPMLKLITFLGLKRLLSLDHFQYFLEHF